MFWSNCSKNELIKLFNGSSCFWRNILKNLWDSKNENTWFESQGPPLTMPVIFQYDQASEGYPPSQPLPQNPQQVTMSSAEKWKFFVPFEWMHILSVMASTAPNACNQNFCYEILGSSFQFPFLYDENKIRVFSTKIISWRDKMPTGWSIWMTLYIYNRWSCHALLSHSVVAQMKSINVPDNYFMTLLSVSIFTGRPLALPTITGARGVHKWHQGYIT